MSKRGRGYLNMGLPWILQLILAIFPLTSWLLGSITRLQRGHLIAGLLHLFGIATIVFWVLDIFTSATAKDLTFFA